MKTKQSSKRPREALDLTDFLEMDQHRCSPFPQQEAKEYDQTHSMKPTVSW